MPRANTHRATAARPELFFGLVRPTGCSGDDVIAALRAELSRVGYTAEPTIKVSSLLYSFREYAHLRKAHELENIRIEKHMDAGDDLRKRFEDGGAFAYLMAEAVVLARPAGGRNIAWIFDSLKHEREVQVLRSLYGDHFVLISIYADQDERLRTLTRTIVRSRGGRAEAESLATDLITRDQEGAESNPYGQDVRHTFPLADYFVSTTRDMRKQVARLIETLFGRPTRSPTRDEYAMCIARSAALRSADLSRQVGAVIVDDDGELVVAGCNEVPKPGGGVYWEGDPQDRRDFTLGYDPNAETSREMLVELFTRLHKHDWLSKTASKSGPEKLARRALGERILQKARVTSLVEFGRIVHAEMNALLRAASSNVSIRGMRMICTTFPCHICARHLLGAGLSEVVYVEPYPKSLAPSQYPDAIVVGERQVPGALMFRPFMGWSAARYARVFNFGGRKDEAGYLLEWDPFNALPKIDRLGDMHQHVEHKLIYKTISLLESQGLHRKKSATQLRPDAPRRKDLR